jgi:hypothetical protein
MTDNNQPPAEAIVPCEVCLKEVPASAAKSEEAADYVHHFCGLDCYEKWQKQLEQKKE